MNKAFGKKGLTLITALMAVVLVVSGRGSGGNSGSKKENWVSIEDRYTPNAETPAWRWIKEETTELTWYVNADWWNTDFGKDVVTKRLRKT